MADWAIIYYSCNVGTVLTAHHSPIYKKGKKRNKTLCVELLETAVLVPHHIIFLISFYIYDEF